MTGIADAYPLTRMQGGMLFHSDLAGADELYQNIDSICVGAPFDRDRFGVALAALVDRHPALRTSFDLTGFAEPVQLVHRSVPLPLTVVDLRDRPGPAEQDAAVDEWVAAERLRGFDWSNAPLLRVTIHQLAERRFRLSLSSHHAILDGWSVNALLSELIDHYQRLADDPAAPPPARPASGMADVVAAERAALGSAEAAAFWSARLQGAEVTRLPRWSGRAARAGDKVPVRESRLPADLSAAVLRTAAALRVPVKYLLLAAHLVVLRALAGSAEITTGLVSNGRPDRPDAHRAIGLFLNTLPFRMRLSGGTWRDLIAAVSAAERELMPYRHFPLLDLQQSRGGGELFETSFNFMHFHTLDRLLGSGGPRLDGWRHFGQTSIPFAATFGTGVMALGGSPDAIGMLIAYDADEFTPRQIEDVEERYRQALAAMTADPDADYRSRGLMGRTELRRVLSAGNRTEEERTPQRAHVLFEAQVDRSPDAVAIRFEGRSTTYRELDRRANRIAHALRAQGIGPEAVVGVAVERSVGMIAAVLGVLKAGAAYLPLDLSHPPGRLAHLLADAGAAALVAQHALAGRVPAPEVPRVLIDGPDEPRVGPADDSRPAVPGSPRNAAYVIYTSGSTGQPKGVVIEHRSIANFTATTRAMFRLDGHDRVLQFASLGFDVSVFEIFSALHSGAVLCLARRETLLSLDELADLMRREHVTVVDLPPAVMALLPSASFPDLRVTFVGGEAFTADLVNRWALPGRQFVNGYGPTEATVTVLAKECVGWHEHRPTLGGPMTNHRAYVLDADLHPASVGVPGELCIAGVGLARGYLGRPALTADRFVPDPFSRQPGGRMYRTGDLAARRPDGELDFLGRLDEQVKVRGLRIELGEVVAATEAHPDVRQAAVVLRGGPGGTHRLVAYVVGEKLDAGDLRAVLGERLPPYALPERIVLLDRLPITASGKVDREALPDPDEPGARAGAAHVAPRTDLELVLCDLWSDVLELHEVGVSDDFFLSGGNSLLAMQLMARIREMFGIAVELRSMFERPTVEAGAQALLANPRSRAEVERLAGVFADLCRKSRSETPLPAGAQA